MISVIVCSPAPPYFCGLPKMEFTQEHYPPKKRAFHLGILALFSVINVFLVTQYAPEVLIFNRQDWPAGSFNLLMGALFNILITYNMLGFIAGCFIAMAPISKWDYARRYVRISFITMILIQLGITLFAGLKLADLLP